MPVCHSRVMEYSHNKINRFKGRTEARFFTQFGKHEPEQLDRPGEDQHEQHPPGVNERPRPGSAQASRFCPQADAQAWRLGTIRPCKHGVWLSKHALVRAGPKTLRRTEPGKHLDNHHELG